MRLGMLPCRARAARLCCRVHVLVPASGRDKPSTRPWLDTPSALHTDNWRKAQVAKSSTSEARPAMQPAHSPPKMTSRLLTSVAACPLRATGACLLVTSIFLHVNSCRPRKNNGAEKRGATKRETGLWTCVGVQAAAPLQANPGARARRLEPHLQVQDMRLGQRAPVAILSPINDNLVVRQGAGLRLHT